MIELVFALIGVAATDTDAIQRARIDLAEDAIKRGKPQVALDTVEPAIAAYETEYQSEKRQIFCGMSGPQTLAYMVFVATDAAKRPKKSPGAIAISHNYCEALYLKGYALIDLNRLAEARQFYNRAIAMAPMHSHYLTEMGQTYRYDRDWPAMLDWCKRSEDVAGLSDESIVKSERGLALRCQGYALVELGRWDDAEAIYRKCLKIDAKDEKAAGELKYVIEHRPKPAS